MQNLVNRGFVLWQTLLPLCWPTEWICHRTKTMTTMFVFVGLSYIYIPQIIDYTSFGLRVQLFYDVYSIAIRKTVWKVSFKVKIREISCYSLDWCQLQLDCTWEGLYLLYAPPQNSVLTTEMPLRSQRRRKFTHCYYFMVLGNADLLVNWSKEFWIIF